MITMSNKILIFQDPEQFLIVYGAIARVYITNLKLIWEQLQAPNLTFF